MPKALSFRLLSMGMLLGTLALAQDGGGRGRRGVQPSQAEAPTQAQPTASPQDASASPDTSASQAHKEAEMRAKEAAMRAKLRARGTLLQGQAGGTGSAGGAATSLLAVPGAEIRTQGRGINVLRSAIVDPRTGATAFLGTYDPAYASGAIDYDTLLADALRSPYPAFSLDPSQATKRVREDLLRRVDADMAQVQRDVAYGKAWMLRIGSLLLSDPGLALDRQRFLKKGAEALKTSPEQARAFWNVVAEKTPALSPEWFEVASRIFDSLGAPEVGRALQAMRNPDTVRDGFVHLGLGSRVDELKSQVNAGSLPRDRASAILQGDFWAQVLRRIGVPASAWSAQVEAVKAGRMALDPFVAHATGQLSQAMTDRIMLPWLNGLVLSQAFLERFYQSPALEVVPSFLGGLAPDSELARTFFAADWVLKALAISPELEAKVPGHLTYQNYEFRFGSGRGVQAGGSRGSIRAWITPQEASLRYDPSGSVITFGPSRMAIRSELTSFEGGSREAGALEREATAAYAAEVTRRYDEYARALPELHRLREAAKIIALARWAKARGQALRSEPSVVVRQIPASLRQGFWTATFQADAARFLFVISAHGGVDFDTKVGDGWMQSQADPGLASSALKQLVGSAALGQQAAEAALAGDLEGARALAQKSEQAMIGDLREGFPPMAVIPEVPEPATYAAFQNQALAKSQEAMEALRSGDESQAGKAQERLRELRELMVQGQRSPGSARQLLVQLRGGSGAVLPSGSSGAVLVQTPVQTQALAQAPAAPAVAPPPPPPPLPPVQAASPSSDSPAEPSSEPAIERATLARPAVEMAPEERARVLAELNQLRMELCRVQSSLTRFNATIQADQQQRAQWEKLTQDTYQGALEKAKGIVLDELKDLSLEWPKGHLEKKLAGATPAERARIQRSLRLVQHLKESYDLKDFAAWAAKENYGREEILEGLKMTIELTGLDEYIKEKLVKKWGLKRVLAFKNAAQDVIASAYDVTAEVLSWRRLAQLNRNSEDFLRAVRATAERQKAVMEGIRQREERLGLMPGSTKGCPGH